VVNFILAALVLAFPQQFASPVMEKIHHGTRWR
jgi:hypothetical protein